MTNLSLSSAGSPSTPAPGGDRAYKIRLVRPVSRRLPPFGRRPLSARLRRPRTRSRTAALLKGFGRRPLAGALGRALGPASESLVRGKPRVGRGADWLGATYGDLKVADGSPMWRRGRKAVGVAVESEHDGPFRGRGCEQRVWERRRESVRGGREDIGLLLRRVAGGAARRGCVGIAATVMRCRS